MAKNLKILDSIELEFAEQDTRGHYRAKLNGKILFREKDEQSYNEKIKEINSFFENKNIVIEKETLLPYKIKEDKYLDIYIDFVLNKIFTGREEYVVNSKYLDSPIGKAKYTSKSYELAKEEFEKITLTDNEKLKIKFLENLGDIRNFIFTQNTYFKELVYAYKILIGKFEFDKIQITNDDKMVIEDGTHKIIALYELLNNDKKISNYSLNELKNRIKTFIKDITIVESKMLGGDFNFEDMEVLDFAKIDEKPSKIVLDIIEGHRELI